MKKIQLLCFSLLIFNISCLFKDDRKIIQYEYNGVFITRINDYPNDIFYYGKFDDLNNLPEDYIISKFSGFDGLMQAYLIFKKDKTAEIRPVADDFTKIGTSSNLSLNENIENIDFIHWLDSIKSNLDNTIELSDVIKKEKERNLLQKSNVKAIYNVEPK